MCLFVIQGIVFDLGYNVDVEGVIVVAVIDAVVADVVTEVAKAGDAMFVIFNVACLICPGFELVFELLELSLSIDYIC
ncbi:MAG: hypothetical protein EZS28_031562 [Streblomastix strix]|uniref:Uncharacterized protein n=1 Tax=Streblomastix strix TaxID=222440 RepID=A0A5J4US78_9EUKA|nr:MAG: hypothetical protein EZS28_031562 [Streblomastix strix]